MESKEELNNTNELSDEELKQVAGGINWQKFGQEILANGGAAVPALSELVAAITNQNWPLVAILAVRLKGTGMPIITIAWHNS